MFEHGIKLQLVAGTGLVRGERPGRRIESEVVVFLGAGLAGPCRNIQRQNKLALLPGIVQKWRRHHVRRRLLRGLGRGGNPDSRRAIGQRDDLFLDDDLFDLLQPLLVKRQNGVAHQLLLLQLADHVAIVARRQVPLLRDLLRDRLHLGLKCR